MLFRSFHTLDRRRPQISFRLDAFRIEAVKSQILLESAASPSLPETPTIFSFLLLQWWSCVHAQWWCSAFAPILAGRAPADLRHDQEPNRDCTIVSSGSTALNPVLSSPRDLRLAMASSWCGDVTSQPRFG